MSRSVADEHWKPALGPRVGIGMPEGRGRIDVKLSTGTVGRSTVDWQHTTLVRHWAMGIVAADKAALEAGVGGRVMSGLAKLWLRRAANARVSLKASMASKVPIGDCSGLELIVETRAPGPGKPRGAPERLYAHGTSRREGHEHRGTAGHDVRAAVASATGD